MAQTANRKTIQPPEKFDPGVFLHPQGHPRRRVIVNAIGANEPLQQFVALNGYPFLILKNREIDLPVPVIEMLKRCLYTLHERNDEGEITERTVPRFSITYVRNEDIAGEKDDEDWKDESS
jgi:hypothetical protein